MMHQNIIITRYIQREIQQVLFYPVNERVMSNPGMLPEKEKDRVPQRIIFEEKS
jgi:hypothetical protein